MNIENKINKIIAIDALYHASMAIMHCLSLLG